MELERSVKGRDWYDNHIPFPPWNWRTKLSHAFFVAGDWIARDHVHDVELRDARGQVIFSVCARVPTVQMPPPPYSAWCCEGRLDDGKGGCR